MYLTVDRILMGRDRITEVLNTYIAPNDALERANNIVQALVLGEQDPMRVALKMLEHLDIVDRFCAAEQVGKAWALNGDSTELLI